MKENIYTVLVFDGEDYVALDTEGIDVSLIFAIEEIEDISKRRDNISKTIVFKDTKANNKVFGNLYDISRITEDYSKNLFHNYKANKKVDVVVLENNIQIIKGKLLVVSIDIADSISYNCIITGNIVDFFSELQDLELSDLDSLSKDTHVYSLATVKDTWSATKDTKYCYPSIDYGYDSRLINNPNVNVWDKTYDMGNFRPAIYASAYLDSIFRGFQSNSTGDGVTQLDDDGNPIEKYTYSSSLRNKLELDSLVVPYNRLGFNRNVSGTYMNMSGSDVTKTIETLRGNINPTFTGYNPKLIGFSSKPVKVFGNDVENYDTFYFKKKLQTSIQITFDISLTYSFPSQYIYFNLGVLPVKDLYTQDDYVGSYFKVYLDGAVGSHHVTLNLPYSEYSGEYMLGVYQKNRLSTVSTTPVITNLKFKFGDTNVVSQMPYVDGDTVNLQDVVPQGIKIKDFLRSVMKQFNLYIIQDSANDRNFLIEPYNSFYGSKRLDISKSLDWTNKADFKSYQINSNISLPKRYEFRYKEDGDMMNTLYKNRYNSISGNYTITDSNGFTDTKVVDTIFSSTINLQTSFDEKDMPVMYKGDAIAVGKKTEFAPNIRLLYFNKGHRVSQPYDIIEDGEVFEADNEFYGYASMLLLDSLTPIGEEFPIIGSLFYGLPIEYFTDRILTTSSLTLYDKYYKHQVNELIDSNLIILSLKVQLKEGDIDKLDFRTPIYIQTKYGASYFKLLEVDYSNSNELSSIKLQRIV